MTCSAQVPCEPSVGERESVERSKKARATPSARKPSLVASSLGWHWEDPASHTAVPYRPRAPEHNTHPPLGFGFTVASVSQDVDNNVFEKDRVVEHYWMKVGPEVVSLDY